MPKVDPGLELGRQGAGVGVGWSHKRCWSLHCPPFLACRLYPSLATCRPSLCLDVPDWAPGLLPLHPLAPLQTQLLTPGRAREFLSCCSPCIPVQSSVPAQVSLCQQPRASRGQQREYTQAEQPKSPVPDAFLTVSCLLGSLGGNPLLSLGLRFFTGFLGEMTHNPLPVRIL